jgi:hypothetical protein
MSEIQTKLRIVPNNPDLTPIDKIREFLITHLKDLVVTMQPGNHKLPEFDLYARDYLRFAEMELDRNDESSLINCVGHLKRAIDCQLDVFLHVYGLDKVFRKNNLKFDKKLDFLREIRVFSSRSLSRLNTIRNKMEHSYEIPKIQELEVYFDLAAAFVAVLEKTFIIAGDEVELEFWDDDKEEFGTDWCGLKYDKEALLFRAQWVYTSRGESEEVTVSINERESFAYFFRVFMLLALRGGLASDDYILSQL